MEKETIFREGDRVFDPTYGGWGVVENIRLESIVVRFGNFDLAVSYGFENAGRKLSFKEYDYVNGGFNQERPIPTISMPYLKSRWGYLTLDKHGSYIWVKNPTYCKTRKKFIESSRHGVDFQAVNGIICIDNLEKNTVYRIIDNN